MGRISFFLLVVSLLFFLSPMRVQGKMPPPIKVPIHKLLERTTANVLSRQYIKSAPKIGYSPYNTIINYRKNSILNSAPESDITRTRSQLFQKAGTALRPCIEYPKTTVDFVSPSSKSVGNLLPSYPTKKDVAPNHCLQEDDEWMDQMLEDIFNAFDYENYYFDYSNESDMIFVLLLFENYDSPITA